MKIHVPIVLYFTAGMVPTKEELEAGMQAHAKFRNSQLHDGKTEKADYVMGEIPESYKEYPVWGEDAGTPEFSPTAGEAVGAFYLHQVERGKWNVMDEDGNLLNTEGTLTKADARALALENTEEE